MQLTNADRDHIAEIILEQTSNVDRSFKFDDESASNVFMAIMPRLEQRPDRPDNLDAYVAKAAQREALKWHIRAKSKQPFRCFTYDDTKLRLDHHRGRTACQTERVAPGQLQRFFSLDNESYELFNIMQTYNVLAAEDRELIASLAHLHDASSIAAIARQRKRSRQSVHRSARRIATMLRRTCATNTKNSVVKDETS